MNQTELFELVNDRLEFLRNAFGHSLEISGTLVPVSAVDVLIGENPAYRIAHENYYGDDLFIVYSHRGGRLLPIASVMEIDSVMVAVFSNLVDGLLQIRSKLPKTNLEG